MTRRWWGMAAAFLLSGCAAFTSLRSDISTFGEWPTGRSPGSYAFERLPSQQTEPEFMLRLERAATPALQAAGFGAAPAGQVADVTVQLAYRSTRADVDPWVDPIWWRGAVVGPRRPWLGPRWPIAMQADFPRYEREVALLIRDAATGKPLYEARAAHEGSGQASDSLVNALFRAALIDFPRTGINPRSVVVPLP